MRPILALSLFLLSGLLTGCATSKPVVRAEVPSSLLTCQDSPKVPRKGATSKQAAQYMVDLYDAHDDCHIKLGAVRGLVRSAH